LVAEPFCIFRLKKSPHNSIHRMPITALVASDWPPMTMVVRVYLKKLKRDTFLNLF
jgi:hypothetical protein